MSRRKNTTYGRHKTIHPTIRDKIQAVWDIAGVDRVIVGPSRGIRHNRSVGSLKIQADIGNAVRMLAFTDRGVSEFYVITSDHDNVRERLTKKFNLDDE